LLITSTRIAKAGWQTEIVEKNVLQLPSGWMQAIRKTAIYSARTRTCFGDHYIFVASHWRNRAEK
jgi:hypothetical protein